MKTLLLTVTTLLLISPTFAADFVSTGDNVVTDGIPPVPVELAREVDRYAEYRTARFLAWHPERLEMLISTRFGDTSQVHRVTEPGGRRMQATFFPEPVLGLGAYAVKDGKEFFTFSMDEGGDEFYQVYRFDPSSGRAERLSDGEKRNGGGVYSDASGLLAYQRVDADAQGAYTEIRTVDPLDPATDTLVTTFRGGGWRPTDWSPDGKRLLALEYVSINDSRLWEIDAATGEAKRLLPVEMGDQPIAHGGGEYVPRGKGFFYTSDAGGEFRQLTYTGPKGTRSFTEPLQWDVNGYEVSPNGKQVAYVTNEAGQSKLYVAEVDSGYPVPLPKTPVGVIGGLGWHNDGRHLAFSITSASIPGDVFVVNVPERSIERWTYSESSVDPSGFAEPELVEWQSFDGRTITGFLYQPPARFTGPRPVIMNIHGGPEGQSRPRYLGTMNYFVNELGCAIIYPNVRGSSGYGKTFLKLDNGILREGTHQDIEALLDWIETRADLDSDRIMVRGGSYGGYMTLSAAYRFSDRIVCALDVVGISNLRTFLENTQGYRRDLRRVEYGDEREPGLRHWMDETSALANVSKIRKPLLVQQGANDPRVPKSESDQIVAALKETGTPVWYLVFTDEGHGFRKKPNADYAFYTAVLFAKEFLVE